MAGLLAELDLVERHDGDGGAVGQRGHGVPPVFGHGDGLDQAGLQMRELLAPMWGLGLDGPELRAGGNDVGAAGMPSCVVSLAQVRELGARPSGDEV